MWWNTDLNQTLDTMTCRPFPDYLNSFLLIHSYAFVWWGLPVTHKCTLLLLIIASLLCNEASHIVAYPACTFHLYVQVNEGDITIDKLSGELLDLVEAKQYPPSVDCLVCYTSPTNGWKEVETTLLRVNLTGTDKGNMCFTCKVKQQASTLSVNDVCMNGFQLKQ